MLAGVTLVWIIVFCADVIYFRQVRSMSKFFSACCLTSASIANNG